MTSLPTADCHILAAETRNAEVDDERRSTSCDSIVPYRNDCRYVGVIGRND